MIGTTRSRVSFFMNKFRRLGFISYNGKIEVNSSLLTAVLYDKPEIKRDMWWRNSIPTRPRSNARQGRRPRLEENYDQVQNQP
jgi:hypothetical protein